MLSVSPGFIRKVIDAGEIPVRRLGRRVVIKDSDLRAWLERYPETRGAGDQ
jgi:excisionase family DNA binding protein